MKIKYLFILYLIVNLQFNQSFKNTITRILHKIQVKLIITFIIEAIFIFFHLDNENEYNYEALYTKNNTMKHAILLLSSYGINYLKNFLTQFGNDKRFDIFIHIDGKTQIDIENKKTILKSNIKYIKHNYRLKRFSIEMVDAMFELLIIADKSDNYSYFHYFSDNCYLIKTLDEFYDFFIRNRNKSYMSYYYEKYNKKSIKRY